jgi:blue copper oxidase
MKLLFILCSVMILHGASAQNPLYIPPVLTGTDFNLDVQGGSMQFYPGNPTPTYGINGPVLSPTIVVNKGDVVTLNVNNGLNVSTTMHWHGLHVAPENDGGPHQLILPGTTWSPSFEILNNAGTFWYHPHGEGKTELHVSKGLAGMFIIHDPEELALGLPQRYGTDDFPLIVQTKALDILNQVAIADHMDTAIFVNATVDAFAEFPAQVVRLRFLNGSSMRTFNFGFSNNMSFYQIATDGGLIAEPLSLTRLLLAPGERSEILVDLSAANGQSFDLMSFASEMPDGIFGAPSVGIFPHEIEMYDDNPLNGSDFSLLQINVVSPTAGPVTSIPSSLVPYVPFDEADATVNRRIVFDTISLLPGEVPNLAEGPFGMNNAAFHMDSINEVVILNTTETWTLVNNTFIAHPFHIHDIQFNIIEKSGVPPALSEQGWKDVVLVMPRDSAKFITRFTTFSDDMTPYMYHCHLLHHEDDGMMGSFLVIDSAAAVLEQENPGIQVSVSPNPAVSEWHIRFPRKMTQVNVSVYDMTGKEIYQGIYPEIKEQQTVKIPGEHVQRGMYMLELSSENYHKALLILKD